MQIAIYCPDRHFLYDGSLPDRAGAGGGLTVRIRIAAALARRGHQVSVICNCAADTVHENVRYRPLDTVDRIQTDILVMHSSGGAIDLTPLLSIPIEARRRIFLLSGLGVAKRVHDLAPDAIYVCSNFIRNEMKNAGIFTRGFFVAWYGINRWNWSGWFHRKHDSHRLIYSSHPSKGFDAAREVARRLHAADPRFRLHYYGGSKLWGEKVLEEIPPEEPCLVYGGLIDQRALAEEYKKSAFLIQLQTRPEPFGIIVPEAMAAGCVVVASPVGAFPEIIRHGENGFLVEGDPAAASTIDRAVNLIRRVSEDATLMRKVRAQGRATPFSWDTIAEAWESHINWMIDPKSSRHVDEKTRCKQCGAATLHLADGYHCTACGYFTTAM